LRESFVTLSSTEHRWSRRRFLQTTAAIGGALVPSLAYAQNAARITMSDLGGATLFQGAGCNVIAISGPEGALMIDGGRAADAEALLTAVREATKTTRIHTLINTHWHPDQIGANESVGRAGGVIFAHEKTKMMLSNTVYNAIGFTARVPALPEPARPNKTTRGDGSFEFGGLQIDYGYMPAAHTDGDLFVHVPKLNLLVVGGVVSAEEWPLVDYQNGAWLGGRVRALERLATLVRPDTRVVAASGRMLTGKEIVRHRDIYQKLYSTLIGYLNMGLGPEDTVQRNPLKEYGSEFGDPSAFLYGANRSMMIAYVPD
jgi:glyoxylase-like metal-dependent hydrolase (beta-lactamase superfamily II)